MSEQFASGKLQFVSFRISDNLFAEAMELGPSLTEMAPTRARSSGEKLKQNDRLRSGLNLLLHLNL